MLEIEAMTLHTTPAVQALLHAHAHAHELLMRPAPVRSLHAVYSHSFWQCSLRAPAASLAPDASALCCGAPLPPQCRWLGSISHVS